MELSNKGNIVLITSGQPALNPRLVKEADALADAGYDVTVLYAYWNNWGTKLDDQLLPTKKWKAIRVGGDPQKKRLRYFFSRFIHKISISIAKLLPEFAIARSSFFLIGEAQKHTADLYIAHNLGALPAAVKAAKKHIARCGFDAEDFHRFEATDNKNDPGVVLKTRIENKYLPLTNYSTASSVLIANAYEQLYPKLNPVVLLNVFPKSNLAERSLKPIGPLKLFWFSQTIGEGRGIEEAVDALQTLKHFELHLLGDIPVVSKSFIEKINNSGVNITYHDPVAPDKLIEFTARFDIGLALENKEPFNRNICLTNKIFTYMQAGLVTIASDTLAQRQLLNEYPGIGLVYEKGNIESLRSMLTFYNTNRDKLLEAQNTSLKLAHNKMNWEQESIKFLNVVKETLEV